MSAMKCCLLHMVVIWELTGSPLPNYTSMLLYGICTFSRNLLMMVMKEPLVPGILQGGRVLTYPPAMNSAAGCMLISILTSVRQEMLQRQKAIIIFHYLFRYTVQVVCT